jgi:hypothetical protein
MHASIRVKSLFWMDKVSNVTLGNTSPISHTLNLIVLSHDLFDWFWLKFLPWNFEFNGPSSMFFEQLKTFLTLKDLASGFL